jgi:hypothetical protein
MPRRIDDRPVYKRYLNGACRIDRLCKECGRKYIGEKNVCPTCRNEAHRKNGKFDAEYHRAYYHRRYSKSAILRGKNELTKQGPVAQLRRAAFEKQKSRIRSELLSITLAKLDPSEDTIEEIEGAGVKLINEIVLSPAMLKMEAMIQINQQSTQDGVENEKR